jgi:hypothetical protein
MKRGKDARLIDRAIAVAYHATDSEKQRAREAKLTLKAPWVFNAFLLLLDAGAPPTESKILAEAKRFGEAYERFMSRPVNERMAA